MNRTLGMTLGMFSIFLLTLHISNPKVYSEELKVNIVQPKNDIEVCWRTVVKGTVSDPKLQVFVAIHPMATNKFWIQPIPNMRSDGKWEAYCYFGEPNVGIGEPFEIIAVASRNRNLFKEGDILQSPLKENPGILIKSNLITVKRAQCFK